MVDSLLVMQEILDEVSAAQMRLDSVLNDTLNLKILDPEELRSVNERLNKIVTLVKKLAGE